MKTLAQELADYGPCAVRTALNNLSAAGHLRRIRERKDQDGGIRWVFRSFFSRTARDNDWWAAFLAGDVPQERQPARPARPRSYAVLAKVGRTDPRMTLSAADCAAELTAGLPPVVHCARALARTRLIDKLPPELEPVVPTAPAAVPLRLMECTNCGIPGRPEALPGGQCAGCRDICSRPAALTRNERERTLLLKRAAQL
ncbi:hypothetical protein NLX86_18025 [Streptomyces sp. A3M-1-3]|uniref:hypothetical protein n=1 Tax=Streptomyces sp. A3M-1-3 TaxID=2962044 RepID=UPI0020B76C94|nr:hypothetical protein [Streptomyces sp. A3M-1-3]MCP3819924.1 hypothetical protein [Streptomyces sp. A3M-1-3]